MMARRPRAPVPRSMAWSAIASNAGGSNSSSTPSSSNSRWYCRTRALRGSVRIRTRAARSRLRTLVITGSRPMNSGISPNLSMSSGITWLKMSSVERSDTDRSRAPKPVPPWTGAGLDDLVETGERATADEQHVGGVDLDELLVRVLAAALRRHVRHRALEHLQQRLLHALAGDVPGDRRVLRLAGDLVDLVDVDDAGLGALDVVVGGLDQLEEDVLDVLADVARLGQRRGVGDRERDVQHPGQGLRQVRLAAAGRAEQQDVGLGQLDRVAAGARRAGRLGLDPLVVVVDRDRERLLGLVLADDVVVEELADLHRLGKLFPLHLAGLGQLLFDDLVAEVDALVADVDTWARDELLDLLLRLAAEGALQ